MAQASHQSPLFAGLSDEQRRRLLSTCAPQSFCPNACIYQHGQIDGMIHLILRGTVQIFAGEGHHLADVSVGQCLGESSLLHSAGKGLPHSVIATAKTQVEAAAFSNVDFSELIRRRPDIGAVIYRNLAADVSTK
ncbi:MAG: cyclic nucleotide-binding domain-containing protein, partial [Planctomycetia bacterium]|nr:cyclic nucleotide-binding domain-containing protein [Planctomycetia bacterium]